MALSNIQPGGPKPNLPLKGKEMDQGEDPARKPASSFQAPRSPLQADQVQIGQNTSKLNPEALVLERILSRTEAELPSLQPADFNSAGKAAFEEANRPPATAPQDAPPSATPERLSQAVVDGITGYIFNAFRSETESLTPEAFQSFREQVTQGFRAGMEDARDILTGLQTMTSALEESLNKTEALVGQSLDSFFSRIEDTLNLASKASATA